MWLGNQKKTLNFNIIDRNYQPVLSLQSCINLGLVKLRDCEILAITATQVDGILEEYQDIFEGLGELPGEYRIITDDSVQPKVHPPRPSCTSSASFKNKKKLDELVQHNVIIPVSEPTEWVHYARCNKAKQNSNLPRFKRS